MISVLDTSAAVEVVLKRESSALFTDFLAEADLVIAPTLLITEATNVFWKYQKFSDYPYDKCEKSIDRIVFLPDESVEEDLVFFLVSYHPIFSPSCLSNQ